MRTFLFVAAVVVAALSSQHRATAQVSSASDDPLRHGHALLIGNSHYQAWPQLVDVPLQLDELAGGLKIHFDTVEVVRNLETDPLRQKINMFLRSYGNDGNARLFIYYAGHGYTEPILAYNEMRGYITGIDTPTIDGSTQGYNKARIKAISLTEIRSPMAEVLAKHILFVFDSCFAGTIFTSRGGDDALQELTPDVVARLMEKPARDIITAGGANERIPAHSPIPKLLLAALNGEADRYRHGVISAAEINIYFRDQVRHLPGNSITPQQGRLQDPNFAEGEFLFRVSTSGGPGPRLDPDQGRPPRQPSQEARGSLPKDDVEAARLRKLVADKADARAQADLGTHYERGLGGLPKDDREAVRLYKLAADQGDPVGQAGLGFFYARGRGGLSKDDREASRLYKLAADQGNARGQNNIGSFYSHGRGGLPRDDREAARLYKLAADQGYAAGQTNLGGFYEEGRGGVPKDDREAARLHKLAANQGHPGGQANLGLFYEEGRGGLPKDHREALRLYKLSADQGFAGGQTNLGNLYAEGRGGLPKDDREAARLYRLATDQEYARGQNNLGDFYAEGRGGLPKDDREAARLFKLAAGQGYARGQNNLANFYAYGRGGLPKDDREAARLYKLAADQGGKAAQTNLGFFYLEGRGGLPKDRREAARLFRLAADQGWAPALDALRGLTR
jgi:TPR repeat protein